MKNKTKKDYALMIRNLMATIEFMRMACEHAEGKTKGDRRRLSDAASVGMRTNDKYSDEILDYQQDTFWEDVKKIPNYVGLSSGEVV